MCLGVYNEFFKLIPYYDIFCVSDNSEFITTMTLHPPFGISRDIVVHAFGANCLTEENSIVLVTKSLSDNEYHNEISKGVEIPPINKGFFSDRVHLHYLYCINTMTSPTSTNFTAVMKLDPKMSVPGSILSWFINQLAGVVLPLLRKQAVYVSHVKSTMIKCYVLHVFMLIFFLYDS